MVIETKDSYRELSGKISSLISPEFGRKLLEFGSCGASVAADIFSECDYLALTDKDPQITEKLQDIAEKYPVQIIPDHELGEDCYFGRFHLVYTLFGFHNLPHLVDEIMRLRRLILKGGQIAVIDFTEGNFTAECTKQLKRCGFENINTETFVFNGQEALMISAQK